jgi:hypothetical protein
MLFVRISNCRSLSFRLHGNDRVRQFEVHPMKPEQPESNALFSLKLFTSPLLTLP